MFARLSMLQPASASHSFWPDQYPIVQIYSICFTHLPGDGYLDFSYFLTIVTVLYWTFTGTFYCSCMSSFLLVADTWTEIAGSCFATRFLGFSELPECFHSICFAHHLFACWSSLLSKWRSLECQSYWGLVMEWNIVGRSPSASSLALHQSLNRC